MMSKVTRNKLSVLAWGGALFCAGWLLFSAQAAVNHVKAHAVSGGTDAPAWTAGSPGLENSN
jgi:hypothetical protein